MIAKFIYILITSLDYIIFVIASIIFAVSFLLAILMVIALCVAILWHFRAAVWYILVFSGCLDMAMCCYKAWSKK